MRSIKRGGLVAVRKAFRSDTYGEADLKYIYNVFRFISRKTIWRTFESSNNYKIPRTVPKYNGQLQYWFGDREEKARRRDLKFVKASYPNVRFITMRNMGHGEMARLRPKEFVRRIGRIVEDH